jgi:AcrR family transcriptional regulator
VTSRTSIQVPTRERIVGCALRLFAERGPVAVSMRELAEAAGVTVPGLYYHFSSKAELISAVYRERLDREPWTAPDPAPVQDLIVEEASREFARFVENFDFLRLMHREASLSDPDARAADTAIAEQWREHWRNTLRLGTDLSPDADVVAVTDVLTTYLWGVFAEHYRGIERPVERRIRDLARVVGPALTGVAP